MPLDRRRDPFASDPGRAAGLFPARLQVELTNLCNFSCTMCPIDDLDRPRGFLDVDLYRRIIDECRGRPVRIWNHFIGEPTLHPRLLELLRYGRASGLELGMSTNGSLLDEELVPALLEVGLERLEISVDAATAATYRRVRGRHDFEALERRIERLFELKSARRLSRPIVSLQFVLLRDNVVELERFVERWRPWLRDGDFLMGIEYLDWAGLRPDRRPRTLAGEPRRGCPAPWDGLVVLVDGRVVPCTQDVRARMVVGDLADASLASIWTGAPLAALRRAHLELDFGDHPLCRGCASGSEPPGFRRYRNLLGEPAGRTAATISHAGPGEAAREPAHER